MLAGHREQVRLMGALINSDWEQDKDLNTAPGSIDRQITAEEPTNVCETDDWLQKEGNTSRWA